MPTPFGNQIISNIPYTVPQSAVNTSLTVSVTHNGEGGLAFSPYPGLGGQQQTATAQLPVGGCVPSISQISVNGTNTNMIFAGSSGTLAVFGTCFDSATTANISNAGINLSHPQLVNGGQINVPYRATGSATPGNGQLTVIAQSGNATGAAVVVSVTLSPTDPAFIPVNATISWQTCPSGGSGGGCRHPYTVTILPATVVGTMVFELSSTSLPGDSTNHCFTSSGTDDPTCMDAINAAPDFFFEQTYIQNNSPVGLFGSPTNNLQTISTNSAVNSATVWVTSRDYGGNTVVTANVTVQGVTTSGLVASTQQPFVQLPIDVNGNGIADAWELLYVSSLSPGLSPTADNETNVNNAVAGDGLTAFEEYRGIVTISNANCSVSGASTSITRTDPVGKQDAFVIDRDGLFGNYASAILVPNSPFCYHLVDPRYGNPLNLMDTGGGVDFLNRNGSSSVYPLVVVNSALDSGTLGQAQSLKNDGKAIRIDAAQIAATATIVGLSSSATYVAQVLAHEVGHKLGLKHYEIINPVDPNLTAVQNSLGLLGPLNYAPASTYIDLYVWSQTYATIVSGQSKLLRANNVEVDVDDMFGLGTNNPTYVFAFSPMTTSAIVDFQVTGGALPRAPIQIRSNIANDEIMDWASRLIPSNLLNSAFWHFDSTKDLPAMCLLQACPNPHLCFTAFCSTERRDDSK